MNLKRTSAAPATIRHWLAVAGAVASLILLILSLLALAGCHVEADTSFTPKPSCDAGQTAQRMPSHQHYMWTCAPGGPAS